MKPNKYDQNNNTGKFRHRIIVQEINPDAVNENGYPIEQWETIKRPWAKIKTVKGSEFVAGNAEVNVEIKRFIIRPTSGLDEKQRIIHKGIIYDIEAILEDDEEEVTYTIVTKTTGVKYEPGDGL